MAPVLISYEEALAQGRRRFYAGPCPQGHEAERYVKHKRCVECARLRLLKWKVENRDRHLAYQAAYDVKRPAWDSSRPGLLKNRDPDAFREYRRSYYQRNRERRQALMRASEKRNIEKHRARVNAKKRNRNAMKARAGGTHSPSDIKALFVAQNGKCAYCRTRISRGYHVDHIQPISRGGSNWPSNLQLLCKDCNLRKAAKDPVAFAQELGRLL